MNDTEKKIDDAGEKAAEQLDPSELDQVVGGYSDQPPPCGTKPPPGSRSL